MQKRGKKTLPKGRGFRNHEFKKADMQPMVALLLLYSFTSVIQKYGSTLQ